MFSYSDDVMTLLVDYQIRVFFYTLALNFLLLSFEIDDRVHIVNFYKN